MIYSLIIFVLLALGIEDQVHDFHISNSVFNYKSEQKSLQVTSNIFIDDLELAVKQTFNQELFLFTEREHNNADSLISRYLTDHIILSIDKKLVQFEFLGIEISDDLAGVWAYMELVDVPSFKHVEIDNTLLLETYDDQKNIINFKIDDKRKAFFILNGKEHFKALNF